jgi:NTE family protein
LKLFIAATNVFTGKIRVFSEKEVTLDAVMASACLPQLYQAVEIDGEPYWDGGFMGNPPLYPLFYETENIGCCPYPDQSSIERREVPRTSSRNRQPPQ